MLDSAPIDSPVRFEAGSPDAPLVLVVDDEANVCRSLADLMRRQYRVIATTSALDAVRVLRESAVALLITDQRMPAMCGADLLALARRVAPRTPRLLLTGYTDVEALSRSINEGGLDHYVSKPWEPAELLAIASSATARYALMAEQASLLRQVGAVVADEPADEREPAGHDDLLVRENAALRQTLENLRDMFWHLRKIQEVLPYCIQCRRVRVEGRGWIDPEVFLQTNTGVVSHGYCEDCSSDGLRPRVRRS